MELRAPSPKNQCSERKIVDVLRTPSPSNRHEKDVTEFTSQGKRFYCNIRGSYSP